MGIEERIAHEIAELLYSYELGICDAQESKDEARYDAEDYRTFGGAALQSLWTALGYPLDRFEAMKQQAKVDALRDCRL